EALDVGIDVVAHRGGTRFGGRRPAPAPGSGARVRAVVDAAQAAGVDVAVDLGRRQRRVAEQLLDRAQVGAALEEVRRVRVAEAVRVGKEPAEGARVEPATACGEKHRVARPPRERGSSVPEPASETPGGLLAERHEALLAALAADMDLLAVEVDVA